MLFFFRYAVEVEQFGKFHVSLIFIHNDAWYYDSTPFYFALSQRFLQLAVKLRADGIQALS